MWFARGEGVTQKATCKCRAAKEGRNQPSLLACNDSEAVMPDVGFSNVDDATAKCIFVIAITSPVELQG